MVMPSFLNVIALICLGLGLMTFPLAVLPAGENIPAAAVLLFGFALTVADGLLDLFGLATAGATAGALIYFWPKTIDGRGGRPAPQSRSRTAGSQKTAGAVQKM